MFLYRRLWREVLNDKKPLLSESLSLASRDGQQRVHPRAEVISIVFINSGRYRYTQLAEEVQICWYYAIFPIAHV